jgi:hypothetical protein
MTCALAAHVSEGGVQMRHEGAEGESHCDESNIVPQHSELAIHAG